MPRTPAQKKARTKYETKAYKIFSVKLKSAEADALKAAAAAAGTTPHTIFRAAARQYIETEQIQNKQK